MFRQRIEAERGTFKHLGGRLSSAIRAIFRPSSAGNGLADFPLSQQIPAERVSAGPQPLVGLIVFTPRC